MNNKEIVLNSINLKSVDKIPTTYRGLENITKSLFKHFGLREIDDFEKNHLSFLENLGADFWASGSNISYYGTFQPRYIGPPALKPYVEDSHYFYTLGIKVKTHTVSKFDFSYLDYGEDPPLANVQNPSEIKKGFLNSKLDNFDFKDFSNRRIYDKRKLDLDYISYKSIKTNENDFICMGNFNSIFMICCFLRGMDNFLMDLAANKKLAEHLIKEVGEFSIEFNRRALLEFGNKAEIYSMWDDVANQNGLMFSPDLLKYFLPIYEKLMNEANKYGLKKSWHCCGSVNDVLPSMIDIGLDIFEVAQTSARNMSFDELFKLYGGKICIHGGIDVQNLLVLKGKSEIEEEIIKVFKLWGNSGGIILAPSHEIVPGTPIENILFLYECINNFQE